MENGMWSPLTMLKTIKVMDNIFGACKLYAESWKKVSSRVFNAVELAATADGTGIIIQSTYGLSVKIAAKKGGEMYLSMAKDSSVAIGDTIDLSDYSIIRLSKEGVEDIYRVIETDLA